MTGVSWLTVYRVWSRSRTQADWGEYRVARLHSQLVYEYAERTFTERSISFLDDIFLSVNFT